MHAKVWTDGCILFPNPSGAMGWAARIELPSGENVHLWSHQDAAAANTNQVAEMFAISDALEYLIEFERDITEVTITSDSQWAIMQMRRKELGPKAWKRNMYLEEWAWIESLMAQFEHGVHPVHTRGHMKTGDWRNEICDKIANLAARRIMFHEDLDAHLKAWMEKLCPTNPGD
jgi:ribonuclease HI